VNSSVVPNPLILPPEATAALVKRHTHDLRNFLNGMEMELTLLSEVADEADVTAAVHRIRQGSYVADAMIRAFAAKFTNENPALICVSDFAEQWMSDARRLLPESSIQWRLSAGHSVIQIRAALQRSVLGDLLSVIAKTYLNRTLEAECSHAHSRVTFRLAAPTTETDRADPFEPVLWSALEHFASRDAGTLQHSTSPAPGQFVCSLTFPAASA